MTVGEDVRTGGRRLLLDDMAPSTGVLPEMPGQAMLRAMDVAADPRQTIRFAYGTRYEDPADWESHLPFRGVDARFGLDEGMVAKFLEAANGVGSPVWSERAAYAANAMRRVITGRDEAEEVVFRAPYDEWVTDESVLPTFVGWLHQLARAYDEDGNHVVRDDRTDPQARPRGVQDTVIRLSHGVIPVFIVEESVIGAAEDGSSILMRQLKVVKLYEPEGALELLNRLSAAEKRRLEQVLDNPAFSVTPQEREHILSIANRGNVQHDPDILTLLAEHRMSRMPSGREALRMRIVDFMRDVRELFRRQVQYETEVQEPQK